MPIYSPEQAQQEFYELSTVLQLYQVHIQLEYDNDRVKEELKALQRGQIDHAERIAENLICPGQELLLTIGESAVSGAVLAKGKYGINKPEETEIKPRSKLLLEQFRRFRGCPEAYVGTKGLELMITLSNIAKTVYGEEGELSLVIASRAPEPSS